MDEKQFKELVDKMAKDAEPKFTAMQADAQAKLDKFINENKFLGEKEFQEKMKAFSAEVIAPVTTKASQLEDALRIQGELLNGMKESQVPAADKTLEDIITENTPKIKEIQQAGTGFIKISLKGINLNTGLGGNKAAAGISSIANVVVAPGSSPTNPYAPGLNNTPLTVYDILRNPNFVSNYTNNGRTNASRVAWINETALNGLPGITAEGGAKPLTSRTFQVEYSQAKKIAAMITLTDEFDQDLPYLSQQVQTLLRLDVLRAFDDQIQLDVINNSTPFSFAGAMAPLSGKIYDATYFDALLAMRTQVRLANFIPNISLINPVLYAKTQMSKDTVGRYNYPSDDFLAKLNMVEGNKIWQDMAIVGDLQQFNVLVYEDFVLKIGFNLDDFSKNQFSVVGEIRFHDFISSARKLGIVYGDAKWIAEQMTSASQTISGS